MPGCQRGVGRFCLNFVVCWCAVFRRVENRLRRNRLGHLLQFKLHRHGHVHRHRLTVQGGRLIFPVFHGVYRGISKKRWAGNDFGAGDAAVDADHRVDFYVAIDFLDFGGGGIERRHGRNQRRLFHLAADWTHDWRWRWSCRLFAGGNESGAQIVRGCGWSRFQIDAFFGAVRVYLAFGQYWRGQSHCSERRFLWCGCFRLGSVHGRKPLVAGTRRRWRFCGVNKVRGFWTWCVR